MRYQQSSDHRASGPLCKKPAVDSKAKRRLPFLVVRWYRLAVVLFLGAGLVLPALSPSLVERTVAAPLDDQNLNSSPGNYRVQVSSSADRGNPTSLDRKGVVGAGIHAFVLPAGGINQVRFFLDLPAEALEDPLIAETPYSTDTQAPFDFGGTDSKGRAKPYDTKQLADGRHTITAAIDLKDGTTEVSVADFVVHNGGPALIFREKRVNVRLPVGSRASEAVLLLTSNEAKADVTFSENAEWLSLEPPLLSDDPNSGTAPSSPVLQFDSSGMAEGVYTTTVTVSASGFASAELPVSLVVGKPKGGSADQSAEGQASEEMAALAATTCVPLACSEVLVDLPYELTFGQDHGKIQSGNGVGTGFTYVDQPTNGTGYIQQNLNVATAAPGTFKITTTAGIAYTSTNSLDNAIGVGIDAPSQISILKTTLIKPPAGSGKFEQAGLWFGNDEDNYVKLIVMSTPKGTKIQYLMEVAGQQSASKVTGALNLASANVALTLRVDPNDRGITASYSINAGNAVTMSKFTAPPEFFSFDAAGIDPEIGTRSFGGVHATHRSASASLVYSFGDFSVKADSAPPPSTGFSFNRSTFPLSSPTSMAWGPDNKLYVSEIFGTIHRITFNTNMGVASNESITTIGNRLTLGITIDPSSTASNVILWVAHSNPSTSAGVLNSSTITRLTGANLGTRQDVITGLPRAIANHAVNSIHFGPDGKLYIAVGGNTGAGAPNQANTEFGTRAEQPLSAALLVADVKATGFDGTCATPEKTYGPAPCSVQVYSSGLRNMYDFVFHSNGSLYGPDNGLGVTGTYPPKPTPPCEGFADTRLWTNGGDNPDEQPDILVRLEQGKYYGHPNPYRKGNGWSEECVFKDGSYQGVSALPNYVGPMHILGDHKSTNGAIEYTSNAFNSALKGQLLVTNYSVGDDITRIKLSSDGRSVVETKQLVGNFNNPLPLIQSPNGTLLVGELGANRVTVLVPTTGGTTNPAGTWTTKAAAPVAILDAGGTALSNKLYFVAGKTSAGPRRTMYVYDPTANSWTQGPSLPTAYPAVENPAIVAYNGKLYAFGGSSAAFSGAANVAAVFDPATNAWTMLASMATARGGATAQQINGKIYVAGGLAGNGASLATVEVYDPANNTWGAAAPMATRRDNPGSAALGGKLYVFGGRTRNANGTTVTENLNTVEMYDPAANTWTARASMPTGRRTMVVGTLNGRAQVIGGERKSDGTTFAQNEEYDPTANTWRTLAPMLTPRHGAVAATIQGVVYVAGGGPRGGNSFSTVNEAFSP